MMKWESGRKAPDNRVWQHIEQFFVDIYLILMAFSKRSFQYFVVYLQPIFNGI
ncbi:hypothetical protein [Chryseobacterium sp. JM1]|uniref:hypothetical protein n=1 Tax=Chryseobacterium sp. JM1 TaxID=1233950 RepID=UPI000AEC1EA5|nr:hypothetical protein [Chryseobacterium sp. JM1]